MQNCTSSIEFTDPNSLFADTMTDAVGLLDEPNGQHPPKARTAIVTVNVANDDDDADEDFDDDDYDEDFDDDDFLDDDEEDDDYDDADLTLVEDEDDY